MVRDFRPDALPVALVDDLLDLARRAPSAGNSQGWGYLVLDTPADVARYWDTTLPEKRRAAFPWPGLLQAPVLVLPCTSSAVYVERYAEPDKARTRLGEGAHRWQVPYWWVDVGMVTQNLLLAAHDMGLGALFFGTFDHTDAVKSAFGIPADVHPVGTVALGWPAPAQRRSLSSGRGRPPIESMVHRGAW